MYKIFLSFILILLLSGCAARGIKKMSNSQLNGKSYSQSVKTNLTQKQVEIKIPAKTNVYKLDLSKSLDKKTLEIQVVSEPVTYNLEIKEKSFNISTNFLVFWYGTVIGAVILWYLWFKRKKNKPVDKCKK